MSPLKRVLSWPWAQAALWFVGLISLVVGAGSDLGANWGAVAMGGILIAAAVALGFMRLQRLRLDREAKPEPTSPPAAGMPATIDLPAEEHPQKEIATRQRKGGFWRGLLNLVVVVGAVLAGRAVVGYATSPEQQVARMSDESLIRQFERETLAASPVAPTFSRLKSDFPVEYAQLMNQLVALVREGATEDRAFAVGRDFMSGFFRENRAAILRGSPESLAALLNAQSGIVDRLNALDAGACAQLIETGQMESGAGMSLLPEISALANAANIAMFDAIRTGRPSNRSHTPITEGEWQATYARAEELGAEVAVLNALGTAEWSELSASRRCAAVAILYRAMNEGEISRRARFAAEIVRSQADN